MSALGRERWQTLSRYLDAALDLGAAERDAWLAALAAEQPAIAGEVRSLLEEHEALMQKGFLESPPEPEASGSLTGQAVGAYTFLSQLGQGGMGAVWLAERSDGRFTGRAAVKLLNVGLIGQAAEERFRREGSFLARLTHPNIAHLIDAGVTALGQPYLVLEYVDGERIDRYCEARALPIPARLRLFLGVLDAVGHAHAHLIVHRDLKPSNVLVRADGQVKLLDFGIAKLLEDSTAAADATLTGDANRVLTPEFASPEQLTGQPITTATDVYALGGLLYVLLAGRHPAGDTANAPAELMKAIVERDPPRLSDAARSSDRTRRALRGDLDTIVSKALKKQPQERYGSVDAMADDLHRYLENKPITARPDTLRYRTTKFVKRHARGVAAAAAVFLLVAGLVGFYTMRLAAERDRARREADKAATVSELLTDLLTAADPYGSRPNREPTVRAILDAGAERIDKELSRQPDVQAEMITTIGRIYQRLGANDKARPLLERALALARPIYPDGHVQLAQTLNDLGVLRRKERDYAAAQPMLEEALAMRRRLLGPEHKDVAVTLVELGRVYVERGLPDRAEPLFRESLVIRQKVLGDEHEETAVSLSDLALLRWQRDDLVEAESLFRRVLAISRRVLGNDHPDVSTALNNLGLVVGGRGDYSSAERIFRDALALRRKVWDDKHPDVAVSLNNLAFPLHEQGKYREAIAALEEAVAIAGPALGRDHPLVANYEANLARQHLAVGAPQQAEKLLRHALAVRERTLPSGDWRIAMTKSLLGAALTARRRYVEAERLLLEANAALRDVPGREGREAKATRERLAVLYDAIGRPDRAAGYRAADPPQAAAR